MAGNAFEGKNILITGGAGSIGSNIVRTLINYSPRAIRIFDNNETALFNFQNELKSYENVRFLVGDVRSRNRLKRAMENIDIVFHTAALKHVPLCEYNPFEAVETNVVGTQNVIDAAMNEEVEKVIGISTDKAINPVNTMGATKLLCEKLITTANYYKGKRKTIFSSVRFGNVLGSRGSVTLLFKNQIKNGGPITLTNPDMTRFFMTMKQAVNLILKATEMARGGEIFIFKMPAVRMDDLVEIMVENLAPKYGFNPNQIKIKKIGIRPGEKMHEELIGKEENNNILETDDMFIILPQIIPFESFEISEGWKRYKKTESIENRYNSSINTIDKNEIKLLLKEEGIL